VAHSATADRVDQASAIAEEGIARRGTARLAARGSAVRLKAGAHRGSASRHDDLPRRIPTTETPSPQIGGDIQAGAGAVVKPRRNNSKGRHIGPDGTNEISYYHPYASRGDGSYPIHTGVEFVNPYGTPVLAAGDGTVVVAGSDDIQVYGARADFYGQLIILELGRRLYDRPVYVLYGHLSEIRVHAGEFRSGVGGGLLHRGAGGGGVVPAGDALRPHLRARVHHPLGRHDVGGCAGGRVTAA
jgi:murein DD-endopeptidase MepM/ murein hydrolase activator NlpD